MQHAERIVQSMLALGVAPGASQLRPVDTAPDLAGLLSSDAALEKELIEHYAEAVRFCARIGDAEHDAFFRSLWLEEQQHGDALALWQRDLADGGREVLTRASF
jgi:bacterioferritin